MKKLIAATLVLLLAVACREFALASGEKRDESLALCAAAHSVPRVLLAYHHDRIDRRAAIERLQRVRRVIVANATGKQAAHLRDVAAAIHVFETVLKDRGDSSDAYRDLRLLRESLPPCPSNS